MPAALLEAVPPGAAGRVPEPPLIAPVGGVPLGTLPDMALCDGASALAARAPVPVPNPKMRKPLATAMRIRRPRAREVLGWVDSEVGVEYSSLPDVFVIDTVETVSLWVTNERVLKFLWIEPRRVTAKNHDLSVL